MLRSEATWQQQPPDSAPPLPAFAVDPAPKRKILKMTLEKQKQNVAGAGAGAVAGAVAGAADEAGAGDGAGAALAKCCKFHKSVKRGNVCTCSALWLSAALANLDM